MLSATEANLLRSKINKAIDNIGKTNGTKLPPVKNNTEYAAQQYWLWSHIARMVDAHKKHATTMAIETGVIFDHNKAQQPVGTDKLVYRSDSIVVTLKVANPSTRVDLDELIRELRKKGVKQQVLDDAVKAATKTNKAPHYFTATLVEKPE